MPLPKPGPPNMSQAFGLAVKTLTAAEQSEFLDILISKISTLREEGLLTA